MMHAPHALWDILMCWLILDELVILVYLFLGENENGDRAG